MDDVTVIDHVIVSAMGGPPARERQKGCAEQEHLEPIIVQADAKAVADQA